MTRIVSSASALLATALLALAACTPAEDPVHLGYVEADWTYVSAPAAGRLVEQAVREGDRIEPGMFLFSLDSTAEEAALAQASARVAQAQAEAENLDTGARAPEIRELQARLAQAEARLGQARQDRDRLLPLVEKGLEPRARADAAESELEAAQAAVEAARQQIAVASQPGRPASRNAAEAAAKSAEASQAAAAYRLSERRVTAPKSGRVEEVFYRAGEYVMPGSPVLSIMPDDALKARFFVPQAELGDLSVGETVRVSHDGLASPATATVTFIAHEAEYRPPVIYARGTRSKLVFMVEARLPGDAGFHPGLPVEVEW